MSQEKQIIDAQDLKKSLEVAAKKLGKRKKINVGTAFNLILESIVKR